ncbi:hypothetical protein GGF44_001671, partial [Coemansia sp. RSA 1694]
MSYVPKLNLNAMRNLYYYGALYNSYGVLPKTRVELRMIKASAFIRSTPGWAEQLYDEEKCDEWATQVRESFKLTDKEVDCVFEELVYCARLKANGRIGEELGGVDKVWINDTVSGCELAGELVCGTAMLMSDHSAASAANDIGVLPVDTQVLVDPFLYPFVLYYSLICEESIMNPKDALTCRYAEDGSKLVLRTVEELMSESYSRNVVAQLDDCGLKHYVDAYEIFGYGSTGTSWLPTDFEVNDDGTVSIRSYINNLHPTRYADLYESIAKVFANFVPLLEQVAADVIHPRSLRVVVDSEKCFESTMLHPDDIINLLNQGMPVPEEYQRFVTTGYNYWGSKRRTKIVNVKGTSIDATALYDAWVKSIKYTEPEPLSFSPSPRPTVPDSMRSLVLQASVEMASINLTPEDPSRAEGAWQAVGTSVERIFAVCLYFYDVENIASAELLFRDQVEEMPFSTMKEKQEFCHAHDGVQHRSKYTCQYSQEVGGVEIKSGRYICYPNLYQTKMPALELADPTRPGHARYIAFYVADPATRMFSTEIVAPQDP